MTRTGRSPIEQLRQDHDDRQASLMIPAAVRVVRRSPWQKALARTMQAVHDNLVASGIDLTAADLHGTPRQ